jgi:uncharacterized repeat protein (TIGR01451 family)
VVLALTLQASLFTAASAQAVDYPVTQNDDPVPGACDANCSLREAVLAAGATSANDRVLMGNLTVTLTRAGDDEALGSVGDLDVPSGSGDLEIQSGTIVAGASFGDRLLQVGSGLDVTLSFVNLDGGDVTGNANFTGGNLLSSADLTINGGQITNGRADQGGGIHLLSGSASLDGVTIENNDASVVGGGGIYNRVELTVTDSRFIGNDAGAGRGGGIDHTGQETLTVTGSHFEGNEADLGGALAIESMTSGVKTVTGTSLVGNTAVNGGGGLFAQSGATLENVTIAGNTVTDPAGRGGGIDIATAPNTLGVHHGTIANNSAPLGAQVNVSSGNFGVTNTLVAGSCRIGDFGTVSAQGDVETGSSCGFTGAGNLRGATVRLGPVTDTGTGVVVPLLGSSDAIDAALQSACLSTDQRGVARPAGECDAGSFEALKTDLSLALAGAPETLVAGDDVTLTLTATNAGPRPTGGVFATLPLPAGASYVSGSPGCSAGPPVICTLGALDPDGVAQATIVARTSAAGSLTFSASVLADLAELAPGNESASATVQVSAPPDPPGEPPPDGTDTRKPSLGLALAAGQSARRARRSRRLKLRLTTDEACSGDVVVRVRSRRLARVRGRSFEAATTTVGLRMSRAAARRLRRGRRMSLRATCTDAAGNAATVRRTARLKR